MGSPICTDDLVAQIHQAPQKALQLLLVLLVLAMVPQVGVLARQTDWAEGLWRPASAASGQSKPVLSACLRRAELPAPMAVHPVTVLGPWHLARGLDPLGPSLTHAAASVTGQRWHVRERLAE